MFDTSKFLKRYREKKLALPTCEEMGIELDEFDNKVENDKDFRKAFNNVTRQINEDIEYAIMARAGLFGRDEFLKNKYGIGYELIQILKMRDNKKYANIKKLGTSTANEDDSVSINNQEEPGTV